MNAYELADELEFVKDLLRHAQYKDMRETNE
jgi:hypothetical protein